MVDMKPSEVQDDVQFASLMKWCIDKGVVVDGVHPSMVKEGGRGMVAVGNVSKGSIILRVPETILLSVEKVRSDKEMEFVLQRANLGSEQLLAMYLLKETSKRTSSVWYPYLDQLPRSYTLLMNFTSNESQELQDEHAIIVSQEARSTERKRWRECVPFLEVLISRAKFKTFAAWLWATGTLQSRTMYIPFDKAGVLTPMGDLFNYAPPTPPYLPEPDEVVGIASRVPGISHSSKEHKAAGYGLFCEKERQYCIVTCDDYLDQEQIFLCYGKYTNLQLLQCYGFLIDDNMHDKHVFCKHDLGSIVSRTDTPTEELAVLANGCPSWNLMIALRMQSFGLAKIPGKVLQAITAGESAGSQHDLCAFHLYLELCEQKLQSYPTTWKDDERVLCHSEDRVKLAVQWRLQQKRLLVQGIAFGKSCTDLLSS